MPTALGAFHVLTEFRFDIGHAVLNSEKLEGAVNKISGAADSALLSFQKLGLGIVGYMGLGGGSVLGLLQAAVSASDKFGQSQRQLANIFLSNNLFTGGNAFEDSMIRSAVVMEDIKKKAQEFALPATELLATSKLIGAAMISHGLDDASLKKTIDISRGFSKSAPTLGIDPQLAMGQLLDAVTGRANMGDTLFQRLMNETTAMKQFKGNPKGFNALPDAKRVDVLTKALLQFGSNAKILEGNARSLTGEIQRLRDSFVGMFSILRPIGDAILNFILPAFHEFNNFLQKQGSQIGKNLGTLMKSILSDPRQMLVNLMQARDLKKDVGSASNVLGAAAIASGVGGLLKFLTGKLWLVHPAIAVAAGGIVFFIEIMDRLGASMAAKAMAIVTGIAAIAGVLAYFGVLMPVISFAISSILLPMTLLVGAFQLLSRAAAIAKVDDVLSIAKATPRFTAALVYLKNAVDVIWKPFLRIFDGIAQAISPIFRLSMYFDALIWIIERVADGITLFLMGFQGMMFVLMHWAQQIGGIFGGQGSAFGSTAEAFNAGTSSIFDQIMGNVDEGTGGIGSSVTNIGSVVIENQFKEQMEPDRIAFTLKEQLMKTAQNPTQSFNRSLSGGLSR